MIFITVCLLLPIFLQGGQSAPNGNLTEFNIVGGDFSRLGQFPYVVSLQAPGNLHICGGSILDSTTVLTAAHCCIIMDNSFQVVAGSNNKSDRRNVAVPIKRIIAHEHYNGRTHQNDICVIQLAKPLYSTPSNYIQPIKVIDQEISAGTQCTIMGWGNWQWQDLISYDQQKFAYIPILDDRYCQLFNLDGKTMVCAGVLEGGTSSCMGDSGGPLVCNNRVVGVTSFGAEICGHPGYPTVYAKAVNYLQWLANNGVRGVAAGQNYEDNEFEGDFE